jgi:hypothetical protein
MFLLDEKFIYEGVKAPKLDAVAEANRDVTDGCFTA